MDFNDFSIESVNNYDENLYQKIYSQNHAFSDLNSYIDLNDNNSFKNQKIINEQLNTTCTLNQIDNNEINEIKKESNNKEVTILGKKRKKSNFKGIHDKYSGDNAIRKIRTILLNDITKFINNLIYEVYNGKINHGILIKKMQNLNLNQTKNVQENKEFLYQTIKEIFFSDLCSKYTNFSSSHNKNLIIELLNEKDEEKRIKFEKIFNLTILDCLNNYKGIINIKEIEPLNTLINEDLKNYEDEYDYFKLLSHYILNFEEIIMRKKSRKRRKNN